MQQECLQKIREILTSVVVETVMVDQSLSRDGDLVHRISVVYDDAKGRPDVHEMIAVSDWLDEAFGQSGIPVVSFVASREAKTAA